MMDTHRIVTLRVVPRASRNEISRETDGTLKVRLHAPPVDGQANRLLIRLLAKHYGVPARAVTIVSGHRGRTKRVRIEAA
jgi:uncharacterized protein